MLPKVHPLITAFEKWIASNNGKRASNPATTSSDPSFTHYLENRLQRAFIAGAKAQWLIDKKRKSGGK